MSHCNPSRLHDNYQGKPTLAYVGDDPLIRSIRQIAVREAARARVSVNEALVMLANSERVRR